MASISEIAVGLLSLIFCISIGLVDHAQSQSVPLVRLVGGTTSQEGRVEIFYNGEWGTVCDDSWDDDDAQVVCRQLGYPTDSAVAWTSTSEYGQGTGPILLDEVSCYGYESILASCPSNGWYSNDCTHYEDAGVRCGDAESVRLVGGTTSQEGRVEILYNGEWGTVCDDSWDDDDAQVVCRQLGYSTDSAVAWTSTSEYGQGTGPILLDEVSCYGYESSLASCPSNGWYSNDCTHYDDAGVRCGSSIVSVRLSNDGYSTSGSVEVLVNGIWGSIRYSDFDSSAAQVVCRQLGFPTGNDVVTSEYGSFSFALDYIYCDGYETSLDQCSYGISTGYGSYTSRAKVQCEDSPATSARVIGTMSFVGISLFLLLVLGIVMVYRSCNAKPNPTNGAIQGTQLTTVTNVGSTPSNQYTTNPSAVPISSPPSAATGPTVVSLPPPYPQQGGTAAHGHPEGNASQPSDPALSGEQPLGYQRPAPTLVTAGQVEGEQEYFEVNPETPDGESTYLEPYPVPTADGENTYQQLDSTQQENSYQDLTPSHN